MFSFVSLCERFLGHIDEGMLGADALALGLSADGGTGSVAFGIK